MDKNTQEAGNNNMDINEEKEKKKEIPISSQTPQKYLRNSKKVNYSQFFSEDQDNSEDYETPEEIKQKIELAKKRKRQKSATKTNTESKKKKIKKEKNDENKNNENGNNEEIKDKDKNKMEIEDEKNKEKENENEDKKNKNNNLGSIINISETLSKYNNETIPNSELILILLEICLNSSQFGIEKDNSSRAFWEEIGKKEELKQITSKFKPETLRKYWRTIRETKKFKKIISEIKKYRNQLNSPNMKLFSSIHAICEYVSNPGRKMEFYLNKHSTKSSNKSNKVNVNDMTPNEQIDDIVNTLIKYFPKKNEKEILYILFKNNFDIENAFLVLKDEENLDNLGFSEKEDEIIKKNYNDNDDKNEDYQDLVYIKGLEQVLRRKEFLFNIKIDRSQFKGKDKNENEIKDDDKMNMENEDKSNKKHKEEGNEENKKEQKNYDIKEAKNDDINDKE